MGYVRDYFAELERLIDCVDEARVDRLVDLLQGAWASGRRVILMGNGGSAATASHIVNDLQKCIGLDSGRPLKAMCLSDNTALVLAWGNDTEFANIYTPQVECWVEPGDLVIGISGSGNSPNVVRAVQRANELGATTFGLAGYDGGALARTAQECLTVETRNMQQIEDVHMAVLHVAFSALRNRVKRD
jgi:D-sedoheptulose 7-phosphate isomerase